MQPIKPCNTYHAVFSSRQHFRAPDGKSAFKVYFCDIVGRKEPARTVWAQCGLKKEEFLARLAHADGIEGVGFITAFPHITKVFRFGPEVETNLHVRAWSTKEMTPLDLGRSQGYAEFGCLAEAAIAAEEFAFWATTDSVEAYLKKWAAATDWPIAKNDKLLAYWEK